MASIGLAIAGALGAAGSIASSAIGSNAAETAAGQQVNEENQALQQQQNIWGQEQQNIAPYLTAGQTGISNLMSALQSGQFGAGSLPAAPQFNQTFTPPTLEQAQQTPGFQFQETEGDKGILEASAASGGAISGGTAKSLEGYNQNLANTSYGNIFNQALSTYGAGLQGYQANLAGYQQNLAAQNQQFTQLLQPAEIGESAAAGINSQGTATAQNIANLMSQIGNAQASGTVGSANALTSGITGATNSAEQSILLNLLLGGGGQNGQVTQIGSPTNPITIPGQGPVPVTGGNPFGPAYGVGPG